MSLIIEDGSIVPNANSYVTVDEIKTYADLRNIEYPYSDSDMEANAILAMDYLQAQCYKGGMVETTQPLLWPRQYVYINNAEFPSDSIPTQLKNAQIELALAQANTSLLQDGTDTGDDVKREKVDNLETEYFEGGKSYSFNSQRVNSYLNYLIEPFGAYRV